MQYENIELSFLSIFALLTFFIFKAGLENLKLKHDEIKYLCGIIFNIKEFLIFD